MVSRVSELSGGGSWRLVGGVVSERGEEETGRTQHPSLTHTLLSLRTIHSHSRSISSLPPLLHGPSHSTLSIPIYTHIAGAPTAVPCSAEMESSGGGGDDKWKLSKKGRSRSGRNYYHPDTTCAAGASTSAGTSGGGGLSRSYSASVTATRDGAGSSAQEQQEQAETRRRLSKKCVEAVKEHRARFYIVRRCVSMLVCWRDY